MPERASWDQEENLRREQEAKALEAKRLQVLEKLAASVPYAEACANAEAKLDHVTGDSKWCFVGGLTGMVVFRVCCFGVGCRERRWVLAGGDRATLVNIAR